MEVPQVADVRPAADSVRHSNDELWFSGRKKKKAIIIETADGFMNFEVERGNY